MLQIAAVRHDPIAGAPEQHSTSESRPAAALEFFIGTPAGMISRRSRVSKARQETEQWPFNRIDHLLSSRVLPAASGTNSPSNLRDMGKHHMNTTIQPPAEACIVEA